MSAAAEQPDIPTAAALLVTPCCTCGSVRIVLLDKQEKPFAMAILEDPAAVAAGIIEQMKTEH